MATVWCCKMQPGLREMAAVRDTAFASEAAEQFVASGPFNSIVMAALF